MIRALLWDIDGTILDFLRAERDGIYRCFEKFGIGECTDELIRAYSKINNKYWEMLERGEITKPEVLRMRFVEFFTVYGFPVSMADEFGKEYERGLGESAFFMPNSLETLKYFQGKVYQAAVTNGALQVQKRKLSKSGLDQIFEDIFISEVTGFEKPQKGFFDVVFGKMREYPELSDIQPDEMLIIGDSLTSDMKGGETTGIRTCWYNPRHAENKKGVRIDFEIDDLQDVIKIVDHCQLQS